MNNKIKTIFLSDFDIEQLHKGTSVNIAGVLLTFAPGSKRDCTKGDSQ